MSKRIVPGVVLSILSGTSVRCKAGADQGRGGLLAGRRVPHPDAKMATDAQQQIALTA